MAQVHDSNHDERGRGALLGMACGDALGTTLEFSDPGEHPWSPLVRGPHCRIIGGGPFAVVPGQVTDDSQMACCLAASIVARGGRFDAQDVAQRYLAWSRLSFDIGMQTRSSLASFSRSSDAASCGIEAWVASGCQGAGNGSLMRCAPIAVLIQDETDQRLAALRDALITHADPRCCLAEAAFCAAIAAGISGADAVGMHASARAELAPAAAALPAFLPDAQAAIAAALSDLGADLDLALHHDPELYDRPHVCGSGSGFVRTAFRLAFWELLHAPDYETAVVDAVNRGGDADTNGAIVGALLGARHGLAAIPATWRRAVLDCRPPAPWDGLYHPRVLAAVV